MNRLLLLFVLLFIGASMVFSTAPKPPQPFEVRRKIALSYIKDLKNPNAGIRSNAARRLVYYGETVPERAVSALAKTLKRDTSANVRLLVAISLGILGPLEANTSSLSAKALRKALNDKSFDVRIEVSIILNAQSTMPSAEAALREIGFKDIRELYLRAPGLHENILDESKLKSMANDIVPKLVRVLSNEKKQSSVRAGAAEVISMIGTDAVSAAPAFVRALKDKEASVRGSAAWAISQVCPNKEEVVTSVFQALDDTYWKVRMGAVRTLGKRGVSDQKTITELIQALNDKIADVSSWAAWSLGELKNTSQKDVTERIVPALINALNNEYFETRLRIVEALGRIGPPAKAAVPALTLALKGANSRLGQNVAWALEQMGPEAREAVPSLIQALKDTELCPNAVDALGSIGPDAKPAVPALINILKQSERSLCAHTIVALGKIGPGAGEAVPSLIHLFSDSTKDSGSWRHEQKSWIINALESIKTPEALKAAKEFRKKMGWSY